MFSLVAHEYAHGYAALKQGDDTALVQGRLTFNPIAHIDLWLTIIIPALLWWQTDGRFVFGGAKPVPVNPSRYRNYRRGDIIVSLAGVATNLVICLACVLLFLLIGMAGDGPVLAMSQRLLTWGVWLNLILCVFNLIPIPPLDGSHVLYHVLPAGIRERYRAFQRFGFLPLLALMLLLPRVLQGLMTPAYFAMSLFFRIASPFAAGPEWNIFQR